MKKSNKAASLRIIYILYIQAVNKELIICDTQNKHNITKSQHVLAGSAQISSEAGRGSC